MNDTARQEYVDHVLHQRAEFAEYAQKNTRQWLLTEREIRQRAEESAARNTLSRADGRHNARRFTGAPLTGFGELS